MNNIFTFIILGLLFSSCASILNNSVQKISIKTDKKIKVISIDTSLKVLNDNETILVERSISPIKLNLKIGEKDTIFILKSHNSIAYWSNIYFNYGLGMFVDRKNAKRFAYPKRTYLDLKEGKVFENRFASTLKGTLKWHIALPHANFFEVKTTDTNRSSVGFWGFESGLDYYYKTNRYLSFYAGAATDFFFPVPAAVDIRGEHQSSSGLYLNLRNNHDIGRFTLGYGLSYSKLNWSITNNIDSTFIPKSSNNSAFGMSFNSSYKFGKSFQLGLLYQPYLFSSTKKFTMKYQHQISIELIWKIALKNGTNEK